MNIQRFRLDSLCFGAHVGLGAIKICNPDLKIISLKTEGTNE